MPVGEQIDWSQSPLVEVNPRTKRRYRAAWYALVALGRPRPALSRSA